MDNKSIVLGSSRSPINKTPVQKTDKQKILTVMKDPNVKAALQLIATYIISSDIRPETNDSWRTQKWTEWLRGSGQAQIKEALFQGYICGSCLCDLQYKTTTRFFKIIDEVTPFDMQYLDPLPYTDLEKTKYASQKLDPFYLTEIIIHKRAGRPYVYGLDIEPDCTRLEELIKSQAYCAPANFLGALIAKEIPGYNGTVSSIEDVYNFLSATDVDPSAKQIINGYEFENPGGQRAKNPDIFESSIKNAISRIRLLTLTSWMDVGTIDAGGYSLGKAYLQAFSHTMDTFATLFSQWLSDLYFFESRLNGLTDRVRFIHDTVDLVNPPKQKDPKEALLGVMQSPLVFNNLLATGTFTANEVRDALGMPPLPEKTETQSTPQAEEMTPEDWLQTKGYGYYGDSGVLKAIKSALQKKTEGKPWNFSLNQQGEAIGYGVPEKRAREIWNKYTLALKDLIKDEVPDLDVKFGEIWANFTSEVMEAVNGLKTV